MYTQCPECGTVFRVTAEVLKQAAGKVRCGGCGTAFNALDYLSEQKPAPRIRDDEAASLPKLEPESDDELADQPSAVDRSPAASGDVEVPASVSAEQSVALLKTLDELAGSDIRIEDTGIEWRVVDDNGNDNGNDNGDSKAQPPKPETGPAATDETGSMRFFLAEEIDDGIAEEIGDAGTEATDVGLSLEDTHNANLDELLDDDGAEPAEAMRFDDNTPLPDDFDVGKDAGEDTAFEADDVRDSESTTIVDTDADTDTNTAQPSATNLALGDPDEWEQLLDEFDDALEGSLAAADDGAPAPAEPEIGDDDGDGDGDNDSDDADDHISSIELQLESATLAGMEEPPESMPEHETDDQPAPDDVASGPADLAAEQKSAQTPSDVAEQDFEATTDVDPGRRQTHPHDVTVEQDFEATTDVDPSDIDEFALAEALKEDATGFEALDLEDDSDADVEALAFETTPDDAESDAADSASDLADDGRSAAAPEADATAGQSVLEVPPETEQEQTINRMIDQDLLALAVPDGEGHTSTVVLEGDEADDRLQVETIIMEGEAVRDIIEEQRLAAETAALEADDAAEYDRIVIPPEETSPPPRTVNYRMLAGVVLLALTLVAQLVHQSRESLATAPAFNATLGPVYRLLGRPITPAWDISGWRFEATRGSTDQADEILTIYSRIGNNSPDALPYPLITVSLTDRFEQMIGSRVVEPAEYLAEDIDSGRLVPPEQGFDAMISLAAPDAQATSYRLSACYRQADGRLRCAMEDFR